MKNKYCLQSSVPFQTINHSPANKSPTKQTFSFSRSTRFAAPKTNCPTNSYCGDTIQRKRSGTSMGYGKKYDFTKVSELKPEGGTYTINSEFDNNKKLKRGYVLGNSREKIVFDSYIDPSKTKYPGIGRYSRQPETMLLTSRAPSFSMAVRTKSMDKSQTIQPRNDYPSPSHYQNNPQMSKTLFGSSFAKTSYSQSKSKRFFSSNNKVPGPGEYENPTNLSTIGKYLMSSHKGGTNAKFGHAKRMTKFDETIKEGKTKPGPGNYRFGSEFGHYDGDVYSMKTSRVK